MSGGPVATHASADERLLALLVGQGRLDADAVSLIRSHQAQAGGDVGSVLVSAGVLGEPELARLKAEVYGLEFVDLSEALVDGASARLISHVLARRHLVLPLGWRDGSLLVALADPANVVAIDDVTAATGAVVRPVVATRESIEAAINRYHRADAEAEDLTAQAALTVAPDRNLGGVREVLEDGPLVKLVNVVITQAIADRASDIHVEPAEDHLRIRYRVDGVLHEVMRPPKNLQAGIISRLKVMADLNIAERRVPQDGRVTSVVDGRSVDLRVATLPTVFGEKVVLRVLDKSTARLDLNELGFLEDNLRRYEASFRKPYGTILVTGPTGSGKSTTLYATLNQLNDATKNVITVEDPVEYQLPGINQVQVNTKAGLTFASALRSILRSDPDVLLVGEIRDQETAIIAIEAALTGHLVLSTLHTNDAATTPGRLVEMGVEPFLVGSSIDCIVAQRLARRLCERCREQYEPTAADLDAVNWPFADLAAPAMLYRPRGCRSCGNTGYHGRFAIHEVLQVTEEVESLICDRAHSDDLRKVALSQGMLPLREAGFMEVRNGTTSIEEILRVIA